MFLTLQYKARWHLLHNRSYLLSTSALRGYVVFYIVTLSVSRFFEFRTLPAIDVVWIGPKDSLSQQIMNIFGSIKFNKYIWFSKTKNINEKFFYISTWFLKQENTSKFSGKCGNFPHSLYAYCILGELGDHVHNLPIKVK